MSTGSLERTDLEGRDPQRELETTPEVSSFTSTRAAPTGSRRGRPDGRFIGAPGTAPEQRGAEDLPADRYLERELSWLQFNERVLQLAIDADRPAARAGPVPRDLLEQPRRVLHGAGRRTQAPHRHRPRGADRGRARAARAARADRAGRARAAWPSTPWSFSTRCAPHSRPRASPSSAGTTSTSRSASRSTTSSPTASSRSSRPSPSTRPTRSPTSPGCPSTSRCCWSEPEDRQRALRAAQGAAEPPALHPRRRA